ncbi:MAG: hypothetical protein KA716_25930 [Gloeotrichia echinulata DEX184]|nr:hypothetical protein [Gloeotrichia echinulata DEX184]
MSMSFEVTEPSKLNKEDITVLVSGGGGKGYPKGQSEFERLNDKLKFVLLQVTPALGVPPSNLNDLATMLEDPLQSGRVATILQLVNDLMR